MFEYRKRQMESLLSESFQFKRLFKKHKALDQQITLAEDGKLAIDDLELIRLKKRKLQAKDLMEHMMVQQVHTV